MAKRETVTLYLKRKVGWRRAVTIEMFVMLWALYVASEGHDPASITEFADALKRDRATCFRWQRDFREAFPMYDSPREFLDAHGAKRGDTPNVRQIGGWTVLGAV